MGNSAIRRPKRAVGYAAAAAAAAAAVLSGHGIYRYGGFLKMVVSQNWMVSKGTFN